jgi:DNA-binding response OmpR family regulator
MNAQRRVLVVSCSDARRESLRRWLSAAGYLVHICEGFREGRDALEAVRADLLVTDVRLKVFNGLHLIIWSRSRNLCSRAVLIGEPDSVLQLEAGREHATYVTLPLEESSLLGVVAGALATTGSARRLPRTPVVRPATINGLSAYVTDVSLLGLRVELRNAEGLVLPEYFSLTIGEPELTCRLRRVWWRRPQGQAGVLLFGAELPGQEPSASWRRFVEMTTSAHLESQCPERATP